MKLQDVKMQDFCSTICPLCFDVDLVGIVCH